MWSSPDVIGLFSINVVSFSSNVVLRGLLFSINLVSKPRMLSVRGDYVLSSLHLEGFKLDKRAAHPLIHEHINPPGRHSLVMPEAVVKGELRPLRNPADDSD
jgi:hypothetical protein